MSHRSRLARAFERAEMQRTAPAVQPFRADPSPPRPTMDAGSLVPFLLAQGELPRWRVGTNQDAACVVVEAALGPLMLPLPMEPGQARQLADSLVRAAGAVEAMAADPGEDAIPAAIAWPGSPETR